MLLRFFPDRRIKSMRKACGWMGPRWQRVRDTPTPWEHPEILTEMSLGIGWNASGLVPEFLRATATQEARRRRYTDALDDEMTHDDPEVLEQVGILKADAAVRPMRWR